jgi:large subunit ribosomal protein L21
MYAIVQHGGHQYRVSSGDRLIVDRLPDDIGAVIGLEPVLLVSDGDGVRTGEAGLDGVRVAATVVAHHRGKKLRILTYKPKKRHRRTLGFRADLTELKVEGILARGEALPASVVIVAEPEAETGEAEAPVANVEAAPHTAVAKPPRATARSRRAATAPSEAMPDVAETTVEAAPAAAAKPASAAVRSGRAAPAAETAVEAPQAVAKPARSRRTAPIAPEADTASSDDAEAPVKRRRAAPRASKGPAGPSDTEV